MRMSAGALIATVAAALLLHPLFESGGWFAPAALAAAATIGGAALGRRLGVPGWAEPLPAVAALLIFVTLTFTSAEAFLALVPTPSSVTRLGVLLEAGWYDINRFAAPVPPYQGITTVTTLGVGGVALAVEFLAVRMRHAALAGLPLLALFSVPVAVLRDQLSWPLFALAATGFLVLLAFDGRERVGRWGRAVTVRAEGAPRRSHEPAVDTTAFAGMGRRLGFAAVVVALIVPAVVPGIRDDGLFGVGGSGGLGGDGGTSIRTPNPIVSLKTQLTLPRDAEVMRYNTGQQIPGYLRMNVLDSFDGVSWTMSTVEGGRDDRVAGRPLPDPQGLGIAAPQSSMEAEISDEVEGMNFLPLPYPTREIDIQGDWLVHGPTLMVFSTRSEAAGSTYRATVLDVRPTRDQLSAATSPPGGTQAMGRYLSVPRVDRRIRGLVTEITEGAANPYERAVAIQEWFTTAGRFRYDVTVRNGSGTAALAEFLFNSRAGYCEQFAASMALMARMSGIPARVAVGYTSGTRGANGGWSVSTRDAHAWPELFFEGVGWTRFEPTPSGLAGQGSATVPAWTIPPPPTTGPGTGGPTPEATTPESTAPQDSPTATARPLRPEELDPGADAGGTVGPVEDQQNTGWIGWLALVLAMLVCWPRLQRTAVRRWRWARARGDTDAARAAWHELRDDVVDLAGDWRGAESPRGAARRLTERYHLTGSPAESLWRIAFAEEHARYAPTPTRAPGLAADSAQVRRAMRQAVRPHQRLRALLLPRSSLLFLGLTLGRGYDTLERASTLPTTWRAHLRRHPT